MIRRPPRSTRTDTLFPYTTLFRSDISSPRRMMPGGFPIGSYVELSPPAEEMGDAEGIETALAVTRDFGIPCWRSEEHTSELQSLMRISYAVFCLNKKITTKHNLPYPTTHITRTYTNFTSHYT